MKVLRSLLFAIVMTFLFISTSFGMINGEYITKETASDTPAKWVQTNDKWYRTDASGTILKNSWFQDVDGKWYYLGEDGAMLTNTNTPDCHYVDENGVWLPDTIKAESAGEYVGGTGAGIEEVAMAE